MELFSVTAVLLCLVTAVTLGIALYVNQLQAKAVFTAQMNDLVEQINSSHTSLYSMIIDDRARIAKNTDAIARLIAKVSNIDSTAGVQDALLTAFLTMAQAQSQGQDMMGQQNIPGQSMPQQQGQPSLIQYMNAPAPAPLTPAPAIGVMASSGTASTPSPF